MYLPLRFLAQMDNFIKLPECRSLEPFVNMKSIKFFDNLYKQDDGEFCLKVYTDEYNNVRNTNNFGDELLKERWNKVIEDFEREVKVVPPDGYDFLDQMIFTQVRTLWGKNKLVYKVNSNLVDSLSQMKIPNSIAWDCISKIPTNCFYFDFGDDTPFCEDTHGCFALIKSGVDFFSIALISLVDSGRAIPITTRFATSFKDTDSTNFSLDLSSCGENILIDSEDGIVRHFKERDFAKFFFNFMIYLQASNKDVTISERTKNVYRERKPKSEPKNKIKEVKEYEVGFTQSYTIKTGRERVKYTNSSDENVPNSGTGEKRTLSSHYRCAHWHHYWTGIGDNKELIIKWVEGIYIKGNAPNKVTIHKVE